MHRMGPSSGDFRDVCKLRSRCAKCCASSGAACWDMRRDAEKKTCLPRQWNSSKCNGFSIFGLCPFDHILQLPAILGLYEACRGGLRPALVALPPPPSRAGRRYPREVHTFADPVFYCVISAAAGRPQSEDPTWPALSEHVCLRPEDPHRQRHQNQVTTVYGSIIGRPGSSHDRTGGQY